MTENDGGFRQSQTFQQKSAEGLEGKINNKDKEQKPGSGIDSEKVRNLYKQHMPNVDVKESTKAEHNIKSIVNELDRVSLHFIKPQNINDMSETDKVKYEKGIARKIKLYDTIKLTGINPYKIELKRNLVKVEKKKKTLEDNLQIFTKELYGSNVHGKASPIHTKILEKLPDAIKHDDRYSSAVQYLENNSTKNFSGKGLKSLLRHKFEDARVKRDLDDLMTSSITEYTTGMQAIKKEIGELNKKIVADPENAEHITKRMDLNQKFSSYESERDYLVQAQDMNVDELLSLESEYMILEKRTLLLENNIDMTRETIRNLNTGISNYKAHIQSSSDAVTIGNHMMLVAEARQIAQVINSGAVVAGLAHLQVYDELRESIQNSGEFNQGNNTDIANLNGEMKDYKRSKVEAFKQKLDMDLYNV